MRQILATLVIAPLLICALAQGAIGADPDFKALSADAQQVVDKVSGGKPDDKSVCAAGHDGVRSKLISATKSLFFAGAFSGSPRSAGVAAGHYYKALCGF